MVQRITVLAKIFKKRLFVFLVISIFLFSAVSKIQNLGATSLDFDEIYSVKMAKSSYGRVITGVRYDPGNPPL